MIKKLKRKLDFWIISLADSLKQRYGVASVPQIVYRESKPINLRVVQRYTSNVPLEMVKEYIVTELAHSARNYVLVKTVDRYDGTIEVHGLLTIYQRDDV